LCENKILSKLVSIMSISKTVINRVVEEMLANAQEMSDLVVVPNVFEVYLVTGEHKEIQNLFKVLREQTEKRLDKELEIRSRASANGSKLASIIKKILGLAPDGLDGNKEYKRTEDFWIINFNACEGKISVENKVFELKQGQIGITAQFSSPDSLSLDSQFKTVFTVYTDDEQTQRSEFEKVAEPEDEFATKFEDAPARFIPAVLKYKTGGQTNTFRITKEITTVGRKAGAADVDLALECSEKVSRKHIEIRFDGNAKKYFLKSLGIYGTTINGKKAPDSFKTINGNTEDLNLEVELPKTARIALAGGEIILDFESEI
jgi:pSer/pThr/pTyr-binding forkhead associated (FHA) protein